jgi:hypothetical protein
LEKDRTSPSVLARLDFFEVPVRALDQANGEARSARAAPLEEIEQIVFRIAQISLNYNSNLRPVAKFGFGKERSEKFEGRIFMRVTFHVEVNERTEVACAS